MANVVARGGVPVETNYDNVDRTAYTTGSFAPAVGNNLVTFCVFGWHSTADAVAPPTVAGGGATTWTEKTSARLLWDSNRGGLYLFHALQSSWGGSATATITFPSQISGCAWCVVEWDNASTGGTNGSDALRQAVPNSSASATELTATLAALASAESATVSWFVIMGNGTVGAEASSTALLNVGGGTLTAPICGIESHYRTNDTTVTSTTSPAGICGIVGFEVAAAAAAAGPSQRFMWMP